MEPVINNLAPEIQNFLQDGVLMCAVGRELVARKDHNAIYWFRRACDLGCQDASLWMAWCLLHGFGCSENVESAETYINNADFEQVSQSFGDHRLVALAGNLIDHHCGEMTFEAEWILNFAYKRGSCEAAELFGQYYLCSWCDRNIDRAIEYLFPFRDKSPSVRDLLSEAYLPCSRSHTKTLQAKGLYDESVLPEKKRHPRYWLSCNVLFVKKCQFDDWSYCQHSVLRNCGYRPHSDSIKRSWIVDCLELMTPNERIEYLKRMPGFEIRQFSKAKRTSVEFLAIENGKTGLVDREEDSADVVIVPDSWVMRIVDDDGRLFDIKNENHEYRLEPCISEEEYRLFGNKLERGQT